MSGRVQRSEERWGWLGNAEEVISEPWAHTMGWRQWGRTAQQREKQAAEPWEGSIGESGTQQGVHSWGYLYSALVIELGHLIYGYVQIVSVVLFGHIRKQEGGWYRAVDKRGSSRVGLFNVCAIDIEVWTILCCPVPCGMVGWYSRPLPTGSQ